MTGTKKLVLVVFGAITISALGIQAADTLQGLQTNLSGMAGNSTGPCSNGEKYMLFGDRALCVDIYEASAGPACPHSIPGSQFDTQQNFNETSCISQSEAGTIPWRYISLTQAQQMCARSSKRLPSSDEWYKVASGLADQASCVTSSASGPQPAGTVGCVTPSGIHDIVGNVWEWVDAQVVDGTYASRPLPGSGYVALVDQHGIVIETAAEANAEFNEDYAWTRSDGIYGVIRGGFYGSESDAGIFSQNLATALDTKTAGIGFRCVRDI